MTQQVIYIGATPNDGQGDSIRSAFTKTNDNFSQLYSIPQSSPPTTLTGNVGDFAGMYAYDSTYFYYCFANYTGNSAIWAQITQAGNVSVTAINNGTSNVKIVSANANATVNIGGTSNVAVFATTGVYVNGVVSAAGNVRGGNVNTAGNVTGNYILGNGSLLTGLSSSYSNANVVSLLASFGSNTVSTTGNVTGGYILGNGSQLTGLPATYGNANVTTLLSAFGSNSISTTGNVTTNYLFGNGSQLTGLPATYGNSNVTTLLSAFGSNTISTTGTITSGNITGGNVLTGGIVSATGNITGSYILGNGSQLTGLPATYGNSNVTTLLSAFGSNTISTTGNVASGNLSVGSGTFTVGNIVTTGNVSGNIGSSSNYFNTVFATATTALYADLAENYQADANYAPGTVVAFGGDEEITLATQDNDSTVAGVVSTNPAYQMNSGLTGNHVVTVALLGRVPCLIQGPVSKGALMVSAGNGRARAEPNPAPGAIIGKAVQSFDGDVGTIEIVVGRV